LTLVYKNDLLPNVVQTNGGYCEEYTTITIRNIILHCTWLLFCFLTKYKPGCSFWGQVVLSRR